ncbi:MAG: 16S rRNA (cytosine(1402)-N(4))-methyltransferase RsmH [Phycisphaerales bacterium]|nr:16S rRNA (cytosine(1402)-N(4))-methyltransferase RsmH [Phycisphaerales bacterium]
MPDNAPSEPPRRRRPRYHGTHPRKFDEKYKELAPDQYPETIAHVRGQGRTPAGTHVPILVAELVDALQLQPGHIVADCTLGYGGHAAAVLERILPGGRLLGLDIDGATLEATRARLAALGRPIDAVRSNFAGLPAALARCGIEACDAIYADLGVSSMQIDNPARGFSYKHDGPLDMRMDDRIQRTAADWLARLDAPALAAALRDLADEPDADAIAGAILAARARRPLLRTGDLVRVIESATGKGERGSHPATRTFQALRILVNDELGALRNLLRVLPGCLRSGGRAAILTFHSGEDRLVKQAFERGLDEGVYAEVCQDPIRPTPAERRDNPRSAPAKLRWVVRA